jgi:hypothetical protein
MKCSEPIRASAKTRPAAGRSTYSKSTSRQKIDQVTSCSIFCYPRPAARSRPLNKKDSRIPLTISTSQSMLITAISKRSIL